MLGIHYHTSNKEFHDEYMKFECVQVFAKSLPIDLTSVVYVHAPYQLQVWPNPKKTPSDIARAYGYFGQEIKKCSHYAKGYILHLPGGELPPIWQIAKTTRILMKIIKTKTGSDKLKLLLEMPAVKTGQFQTPQKINELVNAIGFGNYGICIDTAHLWGMGQNITGYKSMKKWFDGLERPEKIGMVHLNGSSVDFDSGHDVHEIAFCPEDKIWHFVEYEYSGLAYVVEFAHKFKVPLILEINRGTKADFKKLITMLTKKGHLKMCKNIK